MSNSAPTHAVLMGTVLLLGMASCAQNPASTPSPEEDLATIMQWWNGDYHNDRQIARLEDEGLPIWRADGAEEGGHLEVTSHYRPISLPIFAEQVLYVEESKHGDSDAMFRQHIYTLQVDSEINQIRVKLWNFKDRQKYVGAWQDLSMLANLTPDEMSPLPDNCDLFVSRVDDKFHMPMPDRDCAFGDRYFNYQVLLGADSFWFRDKIVRLADDELITSAGGFTYHELDKVELENAE